MEQRLFWRHTPHLPIVVLCPQKSEYLLSLLWTVFYSLPVIDNQRGWYHDDRGPNQRNGVPIQRDTASETIVQFEDPLCSKAGSTAGNLREGFDYEERIGA